MGNPRRGLAVWAGGVALVAALGFLGCGPSDPAEALKLRAQAYWDARVANDAARSYAYLDPAWRAGMPLESWVASHGTVEWPRAEVWKVLVTGNKATACVGYDFVVRKGAAMGEKGTAEIGEPWVLVRGKWYRKQTAPFETPGAPPECGTPPGRAS